MKSICLSFRIHQAPKLKPYSYFDIGKSHHYFDEAQTKRLIGQLARERYLPLNKVLLELVREFGNMFKFSFSISGTALEQFEKYAPEVINSFQALAKTGSVEFLTETYCHSLSSLKSNDEFLRQINIHHRKIEKLFGVKSQSFCNTEFVYSDSIGHTVAEMGFKVMLVEGSEAVLQTNSPNAVYANSIDPELKILPQNTAFQEELSRQNFDLKQFIDRLNVRTGDEGVVSLCIGRDFDLDRLLDFLKRFPEQVMSDTDYSFNTPVEVANHMQAISDLYVLEPTGETSVAEILLNQRNELHAAAFERLYSLEDEVQRAKDKDLRRDWENLQSISYLDDMTRLYTGDSVGLYKAFINYMNILSDLMFRAKGGSDKQGGTVVVSASQVQEKEQRQYRFADLATMPKQKLKHILSYMDAETLFLALYNSDINLKDRVLSNISHRLLSEVEDMQEEFFDVDEKQIRNAKRRVLNRLNK